MPDKRGFFGRLRASVSDAISKAVDAIREVGRRTIEEIQEIGNAEERSQFDFNEELSEREQQRINSADEVIREVEIGVYEVTTVGEEQLRQIDYDEERIQDYPKEVQEWFYATQDLDMAIDAAESGYQYIREDKVRKYVNDNVKVRRSPHGSHYSAIEYANDIPRGAVVGITDRGGFWYVVVAGSTNPTVERRKKRKRKH